MSILSEFKKVRRHIRLPDGYKLLSFWTSSQSVEMDDGTTLESNKTKWDDASNKKHEHANKSALDSITSEKISKWDKLSEIDVEANKYTHPSSAAGAKSSGLYKIATDTNGHVTGATAVTKTDITNLGIPGQDTNTTYSQATASALGLTKLYTSHGKSTDGTMTQLAITNLASDLVIKRHIQHSSGITINGNWDQTVDIAIPVINGYKYLAALPGQSYSDVSLCEILFISDYVTRVRYRNHRTSAVSFTPSINVLYIKTL